MGLYCHKELGNGFSVENFGRRVQQITERTETLFYVGLAVLGLGLVWLMQGRR